jgi:hypothetical protein
MKIMKWLLLLWNAFWGLLRKRPRPVKAEYVPDVPDNLKKDRIYIIGEDGVWWCVAMRCPCGCGDTIQLSLLPDSRPRWTLVDHVDGTVSLHPSVSRIVGCKSHFFLKRGEVQWCRDFE